MKQIIASITQRGQVTIPAEVQRLLGIKPRDKVTFIIEDSQVRLAPVRFTIETAYGSVKPLNRPEDFDEIARVAKEEHAERVVREMRER